VIAGRRFVAGHVFVSVRASVRLRGQLASLACRRDHLPAAATGGGTDAVASKSMKTVPMILFIRIFLVRMGGRPRFDRQSGG